MQDNTDLTAPDRSGNEAAATGSPRLPLVVYILGLGTFLMLTTEFVVAGILPDVAADLQISLAQAGSLITVFAIGMVVGAPVMTMLTVRLSTRLTLIFALVIFVAGHILVAVGADFTQIMLARFITALATGAFWAVAAVVATRAAGPSLGSRAVGIVGAGGSLATVLGVPLGAYVAQLVGWRGTFWALAFAATLVAALVIRQVPADAPDHTPSSIGSQLAGLRSARLWLVLLACAATSGGVLAVYSFITPLLTDRAGVPASMVPLALTGFGIGSFIGTLLGGRLGDTRPHAVTIVTPAITTVLMLAIFLLSESPRAMIAAVVALGLFGLSANSVLIHLAVRFAGTAATLGSALSVAAFNVGTAVATPIAGAALISPLGLDGPAAVGTVLVALALLPTIALAQIRRREAAATRTAARARRADRSPLTA